MLAILLFTFSILCENSSESAQVTSSQVDSVQDSDSYSETSLSIESSSTSSYSFDDYNFSALTRAKFVLLSPFYQLLS